MTEFYYLKLGSACTLDVTRYHDGEVVKAEVIKKGPHRESDSRFYSLVPISGGYFLLVNRKLVNERSCWLYHFDCTNPDSLRDLECKVTDTFSTYSIVLPGGFVVVPARGDGDALVLTLFVLQGNRMTKTHSLNVAIPWVANMQLLSSTEVILRDRIGTIDTVSVRDGKLVLNDRKVAGDRKSTYYSKYHFHKAGLTLVSSWYGLRLYSGETLIAKYDDADDVDQDHCIRSDISQVRLDNRYIYVDRAHHSQSYSLDLQEIKHKHPLMTTPTKQQIIDAYLPSLLESKVLDGYRDLAVLTCEYLEWMAIEYGYLCQTD